jgi:hypothetical protein
MPLRSSPTRRDPFSPSTLVTGGGGLRPVEGVIITETVENMGGGGPVIDNWPDRGGFGPFRRRSPLDRRRPTPEPTSPPEPEPEAPGGKNEPGDPFDRLADAFMAAMGGNSTPKDTTPYVVVDPNYSEGSGMNWKGIAVVALIGVAVWWAWKKWGGKVTAAAGGE